MQNNVKISTGQNVPSVLGVFYVSLSSKPKLGLKVQLKVQNIDLSITITNKHRKFMVTGMLTIKCENFT